MLQELAQYALQHGLASPPGFAPKAVRWAIWLSETGELVDLLDLRSEEGEERSFGQCPDLRQNELIAGGITRSHFLVDTLDVVVLHGADKLDDKKRQRVTAKHMFFIDLLDKAGNVCAALGTCARFLQDAKNLQDVQQRLSARKAKPTERATFRVGSSYPVESTGWHDWWQQFRAALGNRRAPSGGQPVMRCFMSGELTSPLKTHPKVKGLSGVGGQPAGCVLVGYDKDAFTSYGLEQSDNAAVSAEAATLYVNALNSLVANADRPIGQTMLLYWFKGTVPVEDDPLSWVKGVYGSDSDEAVAMQRARQVVDGIRTGSRPDLADNEFHAASISAAGGRIMVRSWLGSSFAQLAENALTWFEDLAICARDGRTVAKDPGIYALMYSLVRKKLDELPPLLIDALWSAALFGKPIPRLALATAVSRIRSEVVDPDKAPSHARMGLIKAYHARMARLYGGEFELAPFLNGEHPSKAYQAGRLMAVLAAVQWAALGDVGAGVVQRYYAAASTTPALVFGRLIRQSQFHLSKLDKGLAIWYERLLGEVTGKLGDALPSALDLEGQSLFALGYYQQTAALRSGKQEDKSVEEGASNE